MAAAALQKVPAIRNHFILPSFLSFHPSSFDLVVFLTTGVAVARHHKRLDLAMPPLDLLSLALDLTSYASLLPWWNSECGSSASAYGFSGG